MSEENKKPFCARPFYELSMMHDGSVQPCCLLDDYPIGNIKDSSMEELWNCEKIMALREEFISGNISTCAKKIKNKQCHKYYEVFEKDIVKEVVQELPPQKLDLRLNGKCNIECIMCTVWRGPNGVYDQSTFWSEGPEKVFPFLKHIDLLGGEPFVQRDTFKLIDEVTKTNKDCFWSITTNGNWSFTKKIKDSLNLIKLDTITISVDSIFPDTYLKIRKKGNYSQLIKNINDLLKYRDERKSFRIKLDFCVQRLNYHEIFAFIDFCKKKNLDHSFIFLFDPNVFCVLEERDVDLSKYLDKLLEELKTSGNEQLQQIIIPIEEYFLRK
ncbi:hypothetical protein A9Q84_19260 [Halobacteriovorax marinus]|uniref:Radical SAM core domain-containing protein n=1 Tax=Halobacteriovorax marinus TaxID=97084 RepID=A0A1Y5F6C8_9BACT|nr:hypothetical protein A9Q84_19260 [Halobacteriovorax marinus]